MNLQIVDRIIEWYKTYQGELNKDEAVKLYEKLIEEELAETSLAVKNKDVIEFLDWVWDVYWVMIIYFYLLGETDYSAILSLESYLGATNLKERKRREVLNEVLSEIIKSNFSKELSLQTEGEKVGKVIKWPNFVKPNIKRIVKKYNIKFVWN